MSIIKVMKHVWHNVEFLSIRRAVAIIPNLL